MPYMRFARTRPNHICGRFNVAEVWEFQLDDKSKTFSLFIGLVREFVYDLTANNNECHQMAFVFLA